MTLPGTRVLNSCGAVVCAGLMAYALYAQHQLLLEPCPLCILQRVGVIALGLLFFLAAVHDPSGAGRKAYAFLLGIAAAAGAGIAAWHVRVQHLPPDEVPSCGPGLEYMLETFPLAETLKMVFAGSGECASVDWQFLGLSMPAWVLVAFLGLGGVGIWNNIRRPQTDRF